MFYAPAKKSIEISLPWHSFSIPVDRNRDIVRGWHNMFWKPRHTAKPWSPKIFSRALATIPVTLRVILLGRNL